jgi:hypothetical protein
MHTLLPHLGGTPTVITPEAFSTANPSDQLTAVQEAIGRVLLSAETDINGNKNVRARLDMLMALRKQLMEEIALANGAGNQGTYENVYTRGIHGVLWGNG